MYKEGDKKNVFRFGNNYRRLHVMTTSDIEVAADKLVAETIGYTGNTKRVPVRWQRRLAEPAVFEAKAIRWLVINANGIRTDINDEAVRKKHYRDRIEEWEKVMRRLKNFERNLNDILNCCPDTSEDNMKHVINALLSVCSQTERIRKHDVTEFNELFPDSKISFMNNKDSGIIPGSQDEIDPDTEVRR